MADIQAVDTPNEPVAEHRDCGDGKTFLGRMIRYFDVGQHRYKTIERADGSWVIVREAAP
jgi:hypothetical protein